MQFCAAAGRDTDALDRAFASLSLEKTGPEKTGPENNASVKSRSRSGLDYSEMTVIWNPQDHKDAVASKELGILLMAMRKLREGLVASKRTDSFAQRAYIFIIRAAILTSSFESYQPALLHLLYRIHPVQPLSTSEVKEFVGYHILDLVCRPGQYGDAYAVRSKWNFKDKLVEGVFQALIRDDWVLFWKLKSQVDGYQRAIMSWAEGELRTHTLKCLAKTYFNVERKYVESCAGRSWEELKTKDGVGWELEGDRVTIRRIKRK